MNHLVTAVLHLLLHIPGVALTMPRKQAASPLCHHSSAADADFRSEDDGRNGFNPGAKVTKPNAGDLAPAVHAVDRVMATEILGIKRDKIRADHGPMLVSGYILARARIHSLELKECALLCSMCSIELPWMLVCATQALSRSHCPSTLNATDSRVSDDRWYEMELPLFPGNQINT